MLVEKYEGYGYKCAYILLKNPHDAKDALSEAFLKVYKSLKNFEHKNFKGYFLKIVYNCSYDILRRNKKISIEENIEDFGEEIVEFDYEKSEDKKAILNGIQKLSVNERTVLLLKYYYDYDYKSIAEFLKIEEGTVASRLFRAKKNLSKILKEGAL